jgi:biopolymer transport protein ExbB
MTTSIRFLRSRLTTIWTLLLCVCAAALWAADTNVTAQASQSTVYSMYDLIFNKGGLFMWPITAIGFVSVYLLVDGFLVTRKAKASPSDLLEKLKAALQADNADEVEKLCKEYRCMLTRIFGAGYSVRHRGHSAMEETIAEHGAREGMAVRARISYLNTISVVEPMLGLLGTVSGMIKAFANVATMGMGKTSELSNNISEALITTYGGLVVAIPVFAVYMHLRNKVNDLVVHVQDDVGVLVDVMRAKSQDQ